MKILKNILLIIILIIMIFLLILSNNTNKNNINNSIGAGFIYKAIIDLLKKGDRNG